MGMRGRAAGIAGVVVAGILLGVGAGSARGAIRYGVSVEHPEQHLFRVTMEVPEVKGEVRLQMPAWNALYEIRDFSSHVQQVKATVNGEPAEIEKLDKLTWDVKGTGTVRVQYATFWDDVGPFGTQLNAEHAFINPAMILMYVPERRAEKSVLRLGSVPGGWSVASASLEKERGPAGAYEMAAESYDALVDAPIEASKFEEFTIREMSPPVHVVIHGEGYRKKDLESSLRRICAYEIKMMGGAPYPEYTFLFHVGKAAAGGGGGMEHANSTAIYAPSDVYLLNVSAHEYFHLWNVKRIRPATLEPVDYTQEMYTRALWFAEGVTNTYASYTLVRTGLWGKNEFYQDLSGQISSLEARPAERWQSAEQSSLDAWLEKYALYSEPVRSVSYYTKGQVLGVLLDLEIRGRTGNAKSLDDVMRAMNEDFAKQGKFYRDSLDVRLTAEKVTGTSFEEFFAKYVGGAEALPYREELAKAGLELREMDATRAALGFTMERDPGGMWVVRSVEAESHAGQVGLRAGDEILKWNGADPPRRAERWAAGQKPGTEIRLHVRRGEKEEEMVVKLGEVREVYYQVAEKSGATEGEKKIREGMLKGR